MNILCNEQKILVYKFTLVNRKTVKKADVHLFNDTSALNKVMSDYYLAQRH